MAADTMMCLGDEKAFGARKIFTTRQFLCGVAGGMSALPALRHFLFAVESRLDPSEDASDLHKDWDDFPAVCEDCEALLVDKRGTIYHMFGQPPVVINRSFAAIGSGVKLALGSMAYGASAQKAVSIATQYDVHSGGEVVTLPKSAIGGSHWACA